MKIKLRNAVSVLLILSIIMCGAVEIKYLSNLNISSGIFRLAVIVLCALGIALEYRGSLSRRAFYGFLIIAIYLLLFIVIRRYNIVSYFASFYSVILSFFLYAYFLHKRGGLLSFFEIYENIMILIGLITVFFWLFGSVLDVLPGRTNTYYTFSGYSGSGYTYYYLYFENFKQNQVLLGITLPRNCGIYCEAPAFSGMLLYAISIELFSPKKKNWKKVGALLLVIATTQSTKALIALIAAFGLMYITKESKGKSKANRVFRIIASILLIVVLVSAAFYIMEDKATANNSYNARLNHLMAGFQTWIKSPIFGSGYKNVSAIIDNEAEGAGYGGLSMGLTVLLAQGGLYLFAFYLVAAFFAARNSFVKQHMRNYLIFIVVITINLFISNSAFSYPYLFMVSTAYALGIEYKPV